MTQQMALPFRVLKAITFPSHAPSPCSGLCHSFQISSSIHFVDTGRAVFVDNPPLLASPLCSVTSWLTMLASGTMKKKRIEANTSPLISMISSTHRCFPGIHAWKTILICALCLKPLLFSVYKATRVFMSRDSRLAPRSSYIGPTS